MLCLNVGLWLQCYVQYVCMFLTRCHEFLFPATKGHLPRRATFAPNRGWPLVAGTTVFGYNKYHFLNASDDHRP